MDVAAELVADDRELCERRGGHRMAKSGIARKHDPEDRDQDQKQGEQGDKGLVRKIRNQNPCIVIAEFLRDGE
jgi:hypothetical protein